MKKTELTSLILIFCLICLVFSSCSNKKQLARQMQLLEEDVDNPTSIEEITAGIEEYQTRIEDIIQATQQTGVWWKLLGTRYLDNQQYRLALDAFQKAIEIYPSNQNLYYYVGVSAGYMAESALDYNATGDMTERDYYLNLAESAYLRALAIEGRYVRALYGLSVLYVFEMNRAEEAIPYLESLLEIDTKHTEAMFVLARVWYITGQFQKASDLYDRILQTTTDEKLREDAERNKKVVLDALYQ